MVLQYKDIKKKFTKIDVNLYNEKWYSIIRKIKVKQQYLFIYKIMSTFNNICTT